jgi:hypothetical protein
MFLYPQQARFNAADYNMQVQMKEQFRQFVCPETTLMCPTSSKATLKVPQRGDIIVWRSVLLSGHLFFKHAYGVLVGLAMTRANS